MSDCNGLETVYELHVYELLKFYLKSMTTGHESQQLNEILRKEEAIIYGLRKPPESLDLIPITRTKDDEHSHKFRVPTFFNKLNSWGVFPDQSILAGISADSVKSLGQKLFDLFCHRQRRHGSLRFQIAAIGEQRGDSLQSSLSSTEESAGELIIQIIKKPFKKIQVPFCQFSTAVS